jgi:hypothetical protein
VHAEKLISVCGPQLEGADGLDRRNEVNHDKEVGRAVSQGASNESKMLAINSVFAQLFQDLRSGIFLIQRLGFRGDFTVDPSSTLLHRFAVDSTLALDFDQSRPVVKYCGIVTVKDWGTAAIDESVRDEAVDQLFILGANIFLVDALAEISFARTESTANCMDADLF